MSVIRFAFATGEFKQYGMAQSARSCATVGELREELKGVPDETRIVLYHQGEVAPVLGFKKTIGERFSAVAGNFVRMALLQSAVIQSMTVGQLRAELLLLPKDYVVTSIKDGLSAPVYGFQKVCKTE